MRTLTKAEEIEIAKIGKAMEHAEASYKILLELWDEKSSNDPLKAQYKKVVFEAINLTEWIETLINFI